MAYAQEKSQRAENVVELEHGKPLIFGKDRDKGIRLVGTKLEVVSLKDTAVDDLLIHDEREMNPSIQMMLARMRYPEMPEPIGVLRSVEGVSTYDDQINHQVELAKTQRGTGDLQALLSSGDTWVVN